MFKSRSLYTAVLSTALAASAAAQVSTADPRVPDRSPPDIERGSSMSIAAIQTRPQGTLGRNIGLGYGVSGAYLYRLDARGVWSVRAELAAVAYGNESKRSAFSETVGGRVQVNVRTTNYIVPASVGPQLTWPTGRIRPYVNAGVGGQVFMTESAVEGTDTHVAIASSTNQSDVAFNWVAGGGIYVPAVPGMTRVQLDLSMQYLRGGRARYLAPGSIIDLEGGGVRISPLESATHLVMLRLGARIGL